MQSLRTYAGVSLISLCLVAIGFYGGEKRVRASTRFEKLTETTALDTWLGRVCSTIPVMPPQIDPQTGERVRTPPPCEN